MCASDLWRRVKVVPCACSRRASCLLEKNRVPPLRTSGRRSRHSWLTHRPGLRLATANARLALVPFADWSLAATELHRQHRSLLHLDHAFALLRGGSLLSPRPTGSLAWSALCHSRGSMSAPQAQKARKCRYARHRRNSYFAWINIFLLILLGELLRRVAARAERTLLTSFDHFAGCKLGGRCRVAHRFRFTLPCNHINSSRACAGVCVQQGNGGGSLISTYRASESPQRSTLASEAVSLFTLTAEARPTPFGAVSSPPRLRAPPAK